MAVHHSTSLGTRRDDLAEIADARLREAELLHERGEYAGAMFLGGCALECCLKVAICVTLKLDGLPAAFKTHDLEALLLYSGFRADLEAQRDIQKSLSAVVEQWRPDGREKLLYGQPSKFDEKTSRHFFQCLNDKKTGVLPWLQSRTSKQQ